METNGAKLRAGIIRAALKRRGLTMRKLAAEHGVTSQYLDLSIREPRPKGNRIIATALRKTVFDLWPDWYRPDGSRRRKTGPGVFERILQRVQAGEAIYAIVAEPGMPSVNTIARYRQDNPRYGVRMALALDRRGGTDAAKKGPDDLAAVIAALESGMTLLDVQRAGMMHTKTVARYRRLNPDFDARVTALRPRRLPEGEALRRLRERERTYNAARRDRERGIRNRDEAHAIAEKAVSKRLPPQMRGDVKADLVVALLAGTVRPKDAAKAAKEMATAYNRLFNRPDLSLDQDRGGWTIGGLLAAE